MIEEIEVDVEKVYYERRCINNYWFLRR